MCGELGGGFIVETFVARGDPFAEEEVSARCISGDKVSSRAASERFCVDVVATIQDKNVLCATFRRDWETASGVRVANRTIISGEVNEFCEDRESTRRARGRSRMEVEIGFVEGGVGFGAAKAMLVVIKIAFGGRNGTWWVLSE